MNLKTSYSSLENKVVFVLGGSTGIGSTLVEEFAKQAIKKSDARPFKVPEDITLMVVDPNTGNKAKFSSKNTIIESYKSKNVSNGKIKFLNNNRLDTNNILKFY